MEEEDKINIEAIINSIWESGYLIEQRVEPILSKRGYYVQTNDVYLDHETGKTREIDLTALTAKELYHTESHWLFPYLLIECENNKQPVVFFRNNSPINFLNHERVKLSGMPIHFYENNNEKSIRLNDFLKFESFHHYCKGVFATQYCSFQLSNKGNKKKWIALHNENQHDSIQNIIKGLKYEIKKHFVSYTLPEDGHKEFANIQIYYPLIILQGDMYEAYMEKGELKLKPQNHIQFLKQNVENNLPQQFQIDIIKESYLPKYLLLVDKETDEIVNRLKRKKKILENSIQIIVNKIRKEPDSSKHAEILDF